MKLFYSYSHQDEAFRVAMEKFLCTLRDDSLLDEWCDSKINPGDDWLAEINDHLKNSDIIVLLVSQDFLASPAYTHELQFALEHKDTKTIVPIILRPSTWRDTALGSLQALPKDGKAVVSWTNQDDAWLSVFDGIKNLITRKNEIKCKTTFLDSLETIEFVSSSKNNVLLSEIFVWPSFFVYNVNTSEDEKDGDGVLFTNTARPFSLIKGSELSGRTSIARKCFINAAKDKNYPLFLDGDSIHKTLNFDALAKKAFQDQYDGEYTEYKKLNNKILIVDDYNHSVNSNIILWAKQNFGFILILIEDEEYMLFHKDDAVLADFTVFSIRVFNSTRTYELIKKWKSLDSHNTIDSENFDLSMDILENKVRTAIRGNTVLPSHPFYILSVLQALEGFVSSDYKITEYGHCYTALITSQLMKKGVSHNDIGDCFNYLMFLAYEIFKTNETNKNSISEENYRKFQTEYKNTFIVKKALLSRIEDEEYPIIQVNHHEGTVRFAYPYIYYFFLRKIPCRKKY
jgi:hypothetical protein